MLHICTLFNHFRDPWRDSAIKVPFAIGFAKSFGNLAGTDMGCDTSFVRQVCEQMCKRLFEKTSVKCVRYADYLCISDDKVDQTKFCIITYRSIGPEAGT